MFLSSFRFYKRLTWLADERPLERRRPVPQATRNSGRALRSRPGQLAATFDVDAAIFAPSDARADEAGAVHTDEAVHGRGRRIIAENWVAFLCSADLASFCFAGLLSDWFLESLIERREAFVSIKEPMLAMSVLFYFIFAQLLGIYRRKTIFSSIVAAQRIPLVVIAAIMSPLTVAFAAKVGDNYVAVWAIGWLGLSLGLVFGVRLLALGHVERRLKAGSYVEKAVSVGLFCDPLSPRTIAESTDQTVKVMRIVRLEAVAELPSTINGFMQDEVDCVYISVPWVDAPLIFEQLTQLRRFSTKISVIPRESRIRSNHLGVTTFHDDVSIAAVDRPINGWGIWAKRMQDIVVASLLLIIMAPVMIAIAIALKLESKGPVFFRQLREGFNGSYFELWKFRSMYTEMADLTASRQTSRDDPRVTPIGRLIRKTSLDELPQLLNVLQGHMSIVGPRPHASQTRAEGLALEEIAEQYAARHRVKPGLTGWAQINGCRGVLDTADKVRRRVALDIEYIENWSTILDLQIILRTVLLVVHDPAAF